MANRSVLRRIAGRVAARLPFGIGSYVREHARMRSQLSQQRNRLSRQRNRLSRLEQQRSQLRSRLRAEHELGRELRIRATLVDRLWTGDPLESAVAAVVRQYLDARDPAAGRSLSQALQVHPASRPAGLLGEALGASAQGLSELAWTRFRAVAPEVRWRYAPAEYLRTAFRVEPDTAWAELRRLVAEPPDELTPQGWLGVIGVAFGARAERLAGEAFEVAETLAGKEPDRWSATDAERAWLRPWIGQVLRPNAPPSVPPRHISLAVLAYRQPDRSEASTNLGDYIQTLASLGHLVRHRNARFHGPPELVAVVGELQERLRPELRLDTAVRDVTLVPVHRDASNYCAVPERTWMIAFGWYMQRIFGRYDFPMHPHLRPIFISFHCNRQDMLTPAAIDYLRTHAPVGCRDWTTVDLLLSAGVPAFFTGCLTTTVGAVFPELDPSDRPGPDLPTAYVDVQPSDGTAALSHAQPRVQQDGLVANLRHGIDRLEGYRRDYSAVVTSRLHCYLPARSVGAPVEFVPKRPGDIRFNGLVGLTGPEFAAMRDGIFAKLASVLEAILAGRSEAEVYATWRDVNAADVAAAQARRASVPPMPPPSFDMAAACKQIRAAAVVTGRAAVDPRARDTGSVAGAGREVHVALALDGNLRQELPVVVQAMTDNCSQPLHLWILCRDHGPADYARFAKLFPDVAVTWLPCDHVDYGPVPHMLRHTTTSTMDRLLLPELLTELDRIVYHDIDALPLGDVSELYEWDLQGHPLAARSSVAGDARSGFERILRSARRLTRDPAAATDLLRRMYARHGYDFTGFNAGILVLDLARLRADGFARNFLAFVERYGMHDQDVLNCYAGSDRAPLPAQWNAWPAQEQVAAPQILHWAGPVKPWQPEYVALREVWTEYAQRVREREQNSLQA